MNRRILSIKTRPRADIETDRLFKLAEKAKAEKRAREEVDC